MKWKIQKGLCDRPGTAAAAGPFKAQAATVGWAVGDEGDG